MALEVPSNHMILWWTEKMFSSNIIGNSSKWENVIVVENVLLDARQVVVVGQLYTITHEIRPFLALITLKESHSTKLLLLPALLSFHIHPPNIHTFTTVRKATYTSIFTDVIKQFPARHIFHNHEKICWCADDLVPIINGQKKIISSLKSFHQ